MPIETTAFVNALKNTMECIKTEDDAAEVVNVFTAVIVNALKNRDTVYLEGIGEWRSEMQSPGRKKVIFTPDPVLIEGVNE
jgi:nucleoid DNA-binding protein